jgi:protein-L-isoaspartate(D-aspartate) O-methyltransferase
MPFVFFLFFILFSYTSALAQDPSVMIEKRQHMVQSQIEARGVKNPRVLQAMRDTPRESFVPDGLQSRAFEDGPLPIGEGQTISQPYIVAYMTELAEIEPHDRVLEIGTGSGYQCAVLAALAQEVHTIEIVPSLAERAKKILATLGYKNIKFKTGDGYAGWAERGPFDAILVTAAASGVPEALKQQLNVGGRLIIPVTVTQDYQVIQKWVKFPDGSLEYEEKIPVRFVPLVRSKEN